MPRINLKSNHRAGFLGRTQRGKSKLASSFLANFTRCVVFDTKNEYSSGKVVSVSELPRALANQEKFLVVKTNATNSELELVCRAVWQAQNYLLFVEEISTLQSSHGPLSYWFNRCVTQGASKGIGVWFTSQRFAMVNKNLLSQADHLFIFNMFIPNDLVVVQNYLGDQTEEIKGLGVGKCFYYSVDYDGCLFLDFFGKLPGTSDKIA